MIELEGRRARLAICADTGQPSHPQRAAASGARIYLASVFVTPADHPYEAANFERYAAEHSMLVAVSNYGGPTGSLASGGRSAIWSPRGELLVELAPTGPGVALAVDGASSWRGQLLELSDSP